MDILDSLLILVPVLVGFIPPFLAIWIRNRLRKQKARCSPLPRGMLRAPGHSLLVRIDDLQFDKDTYLTFSIFLPMILFTSYLLLVRNHPEEQVSTALILGVIGLGAAIYMGRKFLLVVLEIDKMRLGRDGEVYTGQELDQLMLEGCRVFHDVPFPYGNIDHVVVSKSGVFSVNTKTFTKPLKGAKPEVIIDHYASMIRFPDRIWPIPIPQLESERNWLSKHLTSAVGQTVTVEPMLAIPGWFIKQRVGRGSVYVFNPTTPSKFFVHSKTVNSPADIQRIAHQLDQLVRDVEPSQKANKGWDQSSK